MDSMAEAGHTMGQMSSTGMFAAHLLAALLSGLWLAHGERAAFRILRNAEAARLSGCPVGTVRSRVARARATLTRLLCEAERADPGGPVDAAA
ncbi:hypothetical protein [Streptomyces achromogenes]|uniref:hypothetical protein n=1 Tax=Streptomyces achromogenes TaxID=67255 RepID=UPI0036A0B24D